MEQLMNHGNLLVGLSLDQRLERKQWVVPRMVGYSRMCHGVGAWTSMRSGKSCVERIQNWGTEKVSTGQSIKQFRKLGKLGWKF